MENILIIIGAKLDKINLFPLSIAEEIMQNVKIILTTQVGTVPLDRRLGIDGSFIDEPTPRAMMKLTIFIMESIQEYEPRVEVMEVDFVADKLKAMDGVMLPRVKVRILDEYINK